VITTLNDYEDKITKKQKLKDNQIKLVTIIKLHYMNLWKIAFLCSIYLSDIFHILNFAGSQLSKLCLIFLHCFILYYISLSIGIYLCFVPPHELPRNSYLSSLRFLQIEYKLVSYWQLIWIIWSGLTFLHLHVIPPSLWRMRYFLQSFP
jgi:hypothetical protein